MGVGDGEQDCMYLSLTAGVEKIKIQCTSRIYCLIMKTFSVFDSYTPSEDPTVRHWRLTLGNSSLFPRQHPQQSVLTSLKVAPGDREIL